MSYMESYKVRKTADLLVIYNLFDKNTKNNKKFL